MSTTRFLQQARRWLAPTPRTLRHRRVRVWFVLTLVYAAIAATLVFDSVAGDPYAIADDARQHVFWMQRFTDPALFSNDWIADYFQSVSPLGYVWLYKIANSLGLPPLTFCQILPAILVLLTAVFAFLTALELSALPAAGFAATALLCQSVEFTNALASGTSKGFTFLVTLMFTTAWLRRSRWQSGLAIVAQGLFAPQAVLVSAGVMALSLVQRLKGQWRITRDRAQWILVVGGLTIATIVVLAYALSSSQFGPTTTLAEALTMPEFFAGGRNKFFQPEIVSYLLYGRSGMRFDIALTPVTNLLAITLPLLYGFAKRFPLARELPPEMALLPRLTLSALGWFYIAHLLLFKLHLPSRYTARFFLLVFSLAAGVAIVIWIDALLHWAIARPIARHQSDLPRPAKSNPVKTVLGSGLAALLALVLVLYPLTMSGYPSTSMMKGGAVDLYEYLATQPKDSVIASLSAETSNIPTFAGRTVLTSPEVSIPYHRGYYQVLRQRTEALIVAQHSFDRAIVQSFIQTYGVTHWLLDNTSFNLPFLRRDRWLQQHQPAAGEAVSTLTSRLTPWVQQIAPQCTTFQSDHYQVLDAQCMLSAIAIRE